MSAETSLVSVLENTKQRLASVYRRKQQDQLAAITVVPIYCSQAKPLPVESRDFILEISMPGTTETVVLAGAPYLPGSSLANILKDLDVNMQQLTVITNSGALQPNTIPQQAFDQGFSLTHSLGHHSSALLGLLAAALKPGASLTVYEPASGAVGEAAVPVKKALLLAGFVDSTDGKLVNGPDGQQVCVRV